MSNHGTGMGDLCPLARPYGLATFRLSTLLSLRRACAWGLILAASTAAQNGADNAAEPLDPLARKETMIRDRFQRFEDRVFRLQEQLAELEPENAARLARALERAGELALADTLEEITRQLNDPSLLNQAIETQGQWMRSADQLLSILLARDGANEQRQDEIERLKKYKEKVNDLLDQERDLRDATAESIQSGRMRQQLEQAIQRIDALLQHQSSLSQQAQKAGAAGLPKKSTVPQEQQDLSRDADQLADDVERLAQAQPDPTDDTEALQSAREQAQSAAQSIQSGADAMSEAGKSMQQGNTPGGMQQQEKAEEDLKKAREQLEAAIEALTQQPSSEELAKEQQEVADQTGQLADQMKQDAAQDSQGQPGSQDPSESSDGSPSPGMQNIQQAQSKMQSAGKSLKQGDPEEAVPDENQAIEQLEKAQEELEKALSDLRQEERAEALRDLEQRFREMLSKQRAINESTILLAEKGPDHFGRAEHLQLADLAADERTLSQDAATCLHILDEDATTIVYPRVLGQLSQDMAVVAGRLGALRVGLLTQSIEQEIVETLEQLIDAVQKMQQENEQQGGPMSPGDDKDQPLLPTSAELKLLRASQARINGRTTAIARAAEELTSSAETSTEALTTLAQRQEECAAIASEMRERNLLP
ncbi:MAG: hypothetical protein IIC01_02660 [Planctomycetes bacterium]|nr:hypothetical protein [Planctomycetota bacterium]